MLLERLCEHIPEYRERRALAYRLRGAQREHSPRGEVGFEQFGDPRADRCTGGHRGAAQHRGRCSEHVLVLVWDVNQLSDAPANESAGWAPLSWWSSVLAPRLTADIKRAI